MTMAVKYNLAFQISFFFSSLAFSIIFSLSLSVSLSVSCFFFVFFSFSCSWIISRQTTCNSQSYFSFSHIQYNRYSFNNCWQEFWSRFHIVYRQLYCICLTLKKSHIGQVSLSYFNALLPYYAWFNSNPQWASYRKDQIRLGNHNTWCNDFIPVLLG